MAVGFSTLQCNPVQRQRPEETLRLPEPANGRVALDVVTISEKNETPLSGADILRAELPVRTNEEFLAEG